MKKKVAFLLLACLCAFCLSYGLLAYADQTSNGASSKEISGKLVEISTAQSKLKLTTASGEQTYVLAKSVWVYRDQHKAAVTDLRQGDQIEAVMNSKNQAAYIKAYSAQGLAAKAGAVTPTPTASATPTPSATPAPSASPSPTPSATPTPDAAAAPQSEDDGAWDSLAVSAAGANLHLDIKQDRRHADVMSEVKIDDPDHTKLRLQGDSAADVIRQLIASVNLQSPTAEQDLVNLIAATFKVDASQIKVKLDIKWKAQQPAPSVKPAATPAPQQVKSDDNGDRQDGNHQDGSNHDDNRQHQDKGKAKQVNKHDNKHENTHGNENKGGGHDD